MADKFNTSKPHLNIGTIGHVDHGKTTLVSAITTVLAKRGLAKKKTYQEIDDAQGSKSSGSKQRGKTINATHEEFETEERHYSLIDCPGHEDYIKNMITGTAQMDGAILVVSSVEGAQVQTRKHIDLARQIGVEHLVVFINKIDTVPDLEQREMVKMEVEGELEKRGYDPKKTPIIMGSALCAREERDPEIGEKAITELLKAVDNNIPTPKRDIEKPFLMWIENKYKVSAGTVVTGPIKGGKAKMGDRLEIVGLGRRIETSVKGIQTHKKTKEEAVAGDNVGICLSGVKFEEVERGQVLVLLPSDKTKKVTSHTKFVASTYVNKPEEGGRKTPFGNNFRPQFFFETASVTGTIKLAPEIIIDPNKDRDVEFEVDLGESDVVIEKNTKFNILEGNVNVGKGVVTKIIE